MSSDDRVHKIFREEVVALRAQRSSLPRSFSSSNRGGRDRLRWLSHPRTRSRRGQPIVATSTAGPQTGRLLYVTDWESRLHFLVDTGSEVCIIPPSKDKRKHRQNPFGLLEANNLPIVTYGTRSLTLNIGLRRNFQ